MGGVLSDLRARMACYKVGSGFRVHVLLTLAHKHTAVKVHSNDTVMRPRCDHKLIFP